MAHVELEPQQTVRRFCDEDFLSHLRGCKFCMHSANAINLRVLRFCCKILESTEPDKEFLDKTFFSDEAVFQVNGKVCKHYTLYTLLHSFFSFSILPNDRSITSSKASSPPSAT